MRKSLNRFVSIIAILGVLLAGMPVQEAHAATIVVNTDTDKSGLAIFDGLCGLREAVNNANYDNGSYGDCAAGSGADTITFAATYTITLNLGQLLINSPITIRDSTVNQTVLQASTCNPVDLPGGCTPATWRVLEVAPSQSLTLENVMVRHGRCAGACPTAGEAAGGILVNHGTLTLIDSSVVLNAATNGAGIYNGGGSISVTDSDSLVNTNFVHNRALADGAGIFNDGGSLTIDGAQFDSNTVWTADMTNRGAGIYNYGGTANITSTRFDLHRAQYGGALYNENSTVTIQDSIFYGNGANHGGAMYNLNSSPTILRTMFLSNGTYGENEGGAIFNDASSPSLTEVTISNNTAGTGAGMYNTASSPTLQSVIFTANHATSSGGGMSNAGGNPTLTNVTFAGNSTDGSGGAIYNQSSSGTLTNVTISGNSAAFGGGLYNFSSNPTLTNVILWGDSAPSGGPELYNLFSTPVVAYSVVQGGCAAATCTNIITADPVLQPLAGNGGTTRSMALGGGSSAIDTGTNTGCPGTDQRGMARPQGPACDIGAYESKYYSLSGNAGTADAALNYSVGGPRTGFADASGDYSIGVPEHWSGPVTPSKTICNFTPPNRSYIDVISNQSAQNYTATCTPSTVLISGNAGAGGTTLNYDNGGPHSATADPDGAYGFTVPTGWSGTVTPSKPGYAFTPGSRVYSNLASDQTDQDYSILGETVGIYGGGTFYLRNSNSAGPADHTFGFGWPGPTPLVGDWDADGVTTVGIDDGGWFFLRNANSAGGADIIYQYGWAGPKPLVGDWDGDGIDTIGIYHAGWFFLRNSNSPGPADITFSFGWEGPDPLVGDWDGDGVDTIGMYTGGTFFLRNSNSSGPADLTFSFGWPGPSPIVGDWNGDGVTTVGITNAGTFFLRNSNSAGPADITFNYGWGGATPLAGTWDLVP